PTRPASRTRPWTGSSPPAAPVRNDRPRDGPAPAAGGAGGGPRPELHAVPPRPLRGPVPGRPGRRRDQGRAAGGHALGAELGGRRPVPERRERLFPLHAPEPAQPEP